MQPIVLKIANKDGFADYADGLEPDTATDEDIKNLGTLGDEKEPLLATALNLLLGTGKLKLPEPFVSKDLLIEDPFLLKSQGMHLDKNWFLDHGKR